MRRFALWIICFSFISGCAMTDVADLNSREIQKMRSRFNSLYDELARVQQERADLSTKLLNFKEKVTASIWSLQQGRDNCEMKYRRNDEDRFKLDQKIDALIQSLRRWGIKIDSNKLESEYQKKMGRAFPKTTIELKPKAK